MELGDTGRVGSCLTPLPFVPDGTSVLTLRSSPSSPPAPSEVARDPGPSNHGAPTARHRDWSMGGHMTQRGPIQSLQELYEKTSLFAGVAKSGPLEATPPPAAGGGVRVTVGRWGEVPPKEIEMPFPEEPGMWVWLARTTDGHHRHYQQQVVGAELTRCQIDHWRPGIPNYSG